MGIFNNQKNVTNVGSFDCLDENNKPKEFDNDVMDLVFILDKSGSMYDLVDDTIGGFNSYIEKEKEKDEKILVTLVLFDTKYTVLYSRKPIGEVEKLTDELSNLKHEIKAFEEEKNNLDKLKEEKKELEKQNKQLHSNIDDIQKQLKSQEQNAKSLNNKVTTLQTDKEELNKKIKEQDKKITSLIMSMVIAHRRRDATRKLLNGRGG